jgi:hypothetical protein
MIKRSESMYEPANLLESDKKDHSSLDQVLEISPPQDRRGSALRRNSTTNLEESPLFFDSIEG